MTRICVFCGSNTGIRPGYAQLAVEVARTLVSSGYGIVYGGGSIGLMGVLADATLAAGGDVTGIIPEALSRAEVAHAGLRRLHVVASMHERKALMAASSDAFIAMPGGFGTMDEFCEVLSWRQLGIHDKPIGLLDYDGYFRHLNALFDSMVREGFLAPTHRALFVQSESIETLLQLMFESTETPV